MNKIFFLPLCCIVCAYGKVFGQNADCKESNFQSETIQNWNWTAKDTANEWMAYLKNGQGVLYSNIGSPFWASTGSGYTNVNHLQFADSLKIDFLPVDGWELVYRNFGKPGGVGQAVQSPSFVLYNKFRSLLRIFIYLRGVNVGSTDASLTLQHLGTGSSVDGSAVLSLLDTTVLSLDKFNSVVQSIVPNDFSQNDGFWLLGDYLMAYDPCVCNHPVQFKVDPKIMSTSTITLDGSIIGLTTEQIVDNGDVVPKGFLAPIRGIVSKVSSVANTSVKYYKSTSNALSSFNDIIGSLMGVKAAKDKKFGNLPSWMSYIPYVGGVFGFVSSAFGGGSKSAEQKQQPKVFYSDFDVQLRGTITHTSDFGSFDFFIPGSDLTNAQDAKRPIYTRAMGIMNLVESPTLEYIDYVPDYINSDFLGDKIKMGYASNGQPVDVLAALRLPVLRHLKLKEPIKYVVNPALDLELKSIEVSIQVHDTLSANAHAVDTFYQQINKQYYIAGQPLSACNSPSAWSQAGYISYGEPNSPINFGPVGPVGIGNIEANANFDEFIDHCGYTIARRPLNTKQNMRTVLYGTPFTPAQCAEEQSLLLAHFNHFKTVA